MRRQRERIIEIKIDLLSAQSVACINDDPVF